VDPDLGFVSEMNLVRNPESGTFYFLHYPDPAGKKAPDPGPTGFIFISLAYVYGEQNSKINAASLLLYSILRMLIYFIGLFYLGCTRRILELSHLH
jgi:hypothetical protein